jgi:Uma2 family endonuclease
MALQQQKQYITIEEFERILELPENENRLLELIDGEIVEKMPTERHGEVALAFAAPLRAHVKKYGLGRVTIEAQHFRKGDPKNSLLPDVSFIAGERPSVEEGIVPQMPDLAVEVQSPGNSLKNLEDKAHRYLSNGTRMVLILNYKKKTVTMITADANTSLVEGEILDLDEVVPGFRIPVAEIFE